jgi:hypothetical protein
MSIRVLTICAISSLFLSGVAVAQQAGVTSGPTATTNVEPSTAIQKQDQGRSVGAQPDFRDSSISAGAPGIQGKPDTQSGPAVNPPANSRGK